LLLCGLDCSSADEQEDLTIEQRKNLRLLVAELKNLEEDHMPKKTKVKIYEDMRQSLANALAYQRGQTVDLRVTQIPAPPATLKPAEIRRIRGSLHASQVVFAHFLCVSPKAVQSWEQGSRRPQSTALRLLTIAKKNPAALLKS
jgi:DNA-binding transcriptional regulator YiaG